MQTISDQLETQRQDAKDLGQEFCESCNQPIEDCICEFADAIDFNYDVEDLETCDHCGHTLATGACFYCKMD